MNDWRWAIDDPSDRRSTIIHRGPIKEGIIRVKRRGKRMVVAVVMMTEGSLIKQHII
jgi:hypothetical protein